MGLRYNLSSAAVMTCLIAGMGAAQLRAVDSSPRAVITREQITDALAHSGVKVNSSQVEPLCAVTTTELQPRLQVVSVEPLDETTAKVRLQCDRSSICLPFYSLLHWANKEQARSAAARWDATARVRHPRRRLPSDQILVHNGRRAILVFAGADYRIQLPVLCLENGARGQWVRVSSTDRKKMYLARVVSPTVLEGSSLESKDAF